MTELKYTFTKFKQDDYVNVLDKIDMRHDNYLVRVKIEEFNKLFIKNLNDFLSENKIDNINVADYFKMVGKFSDTVNNHLFINDNNDLRKCLDVIRSSELLLEDAIANNDFDAMINSFSSLKIKLKLLNVI